MILMMSSLVQRLGARLGQLLLSTTAVLGALGALAVVLALITGVRPLIFRSGSMEPAVGTGALGFATTVGADQLKVGDVVTVRSENGRTITHRIVAIGPVGRSAMLRLKGDDNPTPDQEIYRVTSVPRLWFAVPKAGFAIAWFTKAPGSYLLGAYVMLMLMLAFRRRPRPQDHGGSGSVAVDEQVDGRPVEGVRSPRPRRAPFAIATASVILALAAAVVSGWSQTTWAAWTDSVAVSGSSINTGAWGLTTCSVNSSKLTVVWKYPNASNTPDPGIKFTVRSDQDGALSTPTDVAKNLRTWTSPTFNSTTGQVNVYAVNAGPTETLIATVNFAFGSGSGGGNKSCTVVL